MRNHSLLSSICRLAPAAIFVAVAIFLAAAPAIAQNDICVAGVGGLAGLPTLDGFVSGDPGWNNALQLNLSGDLGGTTATKALIGNDGSNLWLGLIVSAPAIDQNTTLILGFSANDHPENDWRLHIQPFGPSLLTNPDHTPQHVTVWRDSTQWNTPTAGTVATEANWEDSPSNIQVTSNGSNYWELEFKIPIVNSSSSSAGICLSCNTASPSTFKLYVNVLNTAFGLAPPVTNPVPASASQDVFPPCPPNTICSSLFDPTTPTDIATLTPSPSVWGTGSTSTRAACTGVSLAAYSSPLAVGVQDPSDASNLTTNIQRLNDTVVTQTSLAQCEALADNAPGGPGPANTFVAIPSNNMTNPAQVSVTFRLVDFGIPGIDPSLGGAGFFPPLGSPVPSGCDPTQTPFTQCAGVAQNPTTQAQIDAFGVDTPGQPSSKKFNSTTWALNLKQSCLYKFNAHQCVQVVMDSNDPNTRLLNHSVEENLNFVPASTYRQTAMIHGSQGNVPSPTRFLLALNTDEDGRIGPSPTKPTPPNRGGTLGIAAAPTATGNSIPRFLNQDLSAIGRQKFGSGVTNMYQWIARGYVYTGKKIIVNGAQYEYVRRAGDFGYVAGHTGEISGWDFTFKGADLKQVTPSLYTVVVSPGSTSTVETTITAEPLNAVAGPGKFAAFFDLGANFPNGSFASGFNPGFSMNAGLEYMFNSHFSAEGIFGYHFVPAKASGNQNLYQFSVNAKEYLLTGKLQPFVNGGVGGYVFNPGSSYFGGNFGAGVLFNLTPHWGVEGDYNFHLVNTSGSATKFSTLQGGVRYVF